MNENIEELFEKYDNEYLKFTDIPESERLNKSKVMCGLLKIQSLMKKPENFSYCAEHDCVYLADPDDLVELTDDDVIYLARCGIHFDSDTGGLADFC